jgi:ABC-type transport system substrate-binding protein
MTTVQVLMYSSKKNLDGKIYTQELVKFLLDKLRHYKHVFVSPIPGPKSMEKEIVGDVKSIRQKGDSISADFAFYPAFKHLEEHSNKLAIFFSAKASPTLTDNQEILDLDDVMEPIFFTMVQKA